MVKSVNKDNFSEEVLKIERPVVVDFWADWCGPCKAFAPVIDEFSEEAGDKIKVCKVNIDDEPELAEKYGVMSIPTLVAFKDGKVISTVVGSVPKEVIYSMIASEDNANV